MGQFPYSSLVAAAKGGLNSFICVRGGMEFLCWISDCRADARGGPCDCADVRGGPDWISELRTDAKGGPWLI